MKKIVLCTLVSLLFCSCSSISNDDSNNGNSFQEPRRVSVSELNADSRTIYSYVSEKGYGNKFVLSEGIKVNDVNELYSFSLKETSDFEKSFPKFYSCLMGKDFYKDSGVSDISKLQVDDYSGKLFPFSIGKMYGEIEYIDLETVDKENNTYTTSMYAYPNGKLYYEKDAYFFPGNSFKNWYYYYSSYPDTKYTMLDGSEWTLSEAQSFAAKTYNELYSNYSPDASFEPYIVIPNERDGNYYFAVILRREYCGVPFKCCAVSKETDEVQSKPMFYLCYFYGKEKLTAMINTTGYEDIINPKQITDKVLPVTSALDILDKELAPNIILQIDDVSLVYYNSFDASKYAELCKRIQSSEKYTLTEDENLMIGQPEGLPGTEFNCFPAWEFKLKKNIQISEDGFCSENFYDTKAIYVNAFTGEVITYL